MGGEQSVTFGEGIVCVWRLRLEAEFKDLFPGSARCEVSYFTLHLLDDWHPYQAQHRILRRAS